jgi:hypothetical protein
MGVVYQRATAKLAPCTFSVLLINGLAQNGAIDSETETKVLLRRLKRHRGFGTSLLSRCGDRFPSEDGTFAIFAPVIATECAVAT